MHEEMPFKLEILLYYLVVLVLAALKKVIKSAKFKASNNVMTSFISQMISAQRMLVIFL